MSTSLLCGCVGFRVQLHKEKKDEYNLNLACTNLINSLNALEASESLTNHLNEVAYVEPAIIYKDCDDRVNTNFVNAVAHNNGINFIGVFMDMVAVRHAENGMMYAGVSMLSACNGYEGECLKDISYEDFEAIFVNKTKAEYSH